MNFFFYFILGLFLCTACNSNTILKKPDHLIDKDKMVSILFDTYVANIAKNIKNTNGYKKVNYHALIYKNHQIDSFSFHESLKYYTSDIKQNEEILRLVKDKIDQKLKSIKEEEVKKDSI